MKIIVYNFWDIVAGLLIVEIALALQFNFEI